MGGEGADRMTDNSKIEEKIAALDEDDPVREVIELLWERIKELEERQKAPPVPVGKRP